MTLRVRAIAVLAATTAVATSCTGGSAGEPAPSPTSDPVPVKVVFLQDGSVESPNTHAQPAFLGLKLAFSRTIEAGGLPAVPELVGFDTRGDRAIAAEIAAEIAGDPGYVAAIAEQTRTDLKSDRTVI